MKECERHEVDELTLGLDGEVFCKHCRKALTESDLAPNGYLETLRAMLAMGLDGGAPWVPWPEQTRALRFAIEALEGNERCALSQPSRIRAEFFVDDEGEVSFVCHTKDTDFEFTRKAFTEFLRVLQDQIDRQAECPHHTEIRYSYAKR